MYTALMMITFIVHHSPVISCFGASVHTTEEPKQLTQHLVWDQGAEHICPLLSHGLHSEANYGLPNGSVRLRDIWLSLVLCNPQPSPSAWRPRCAETVNLQLNPTPLELRHSWLFNLTIIPSLVPITRHTYTCTNKQGVFITVEAHLKDRRSFDCGCGREDVVE